MFVHFIKPGYSRSDCFNDPDAAVVLSEGQSLTPSQVEELFGSEEPDLPVTMRACVTGPTSRLDLVRIRVTYVSE